MLVIHRHGDIIYFNYTNHRKTSFRLRIESMGCNILVLRNVTMQYATCPIPKVDRAIEIWIQKSKGLQDFCMLCYSGDNSFELYTYNILCCIEESEYFHVTNKTLKQQCSTLYSFMYELSDEDVSCIKKTISVQAPTEEMAFDSVQIMLDAIYPSSEGYQIGYLRLIKEL